MLDVDQRPAVHQTYEEGTPLDLTFDLTRIRGEVLAWAAILLAAGALRLASLSSSALSPDEARRAFAAFTLFNGTGAGFDGAAGDPFATLFGALLFFLFGVTDTVARLGPVLAGIGTVALAIWLRPYLGRAGATLAGATLAVSPSFAYFSRRAVPDAYAAFFATLLFVAILRTLDRGRRGDLVLAAVAAALLLVSAPVGLSLLLLFALFLTVVWARGRAEAVAGAGPGQGSGEPDVAVEPTPEGFGAGPLAAARRRGGGAAALAALGVLLVVFAAFGAAPRNLVYGPVDLLRAWATSLLGSAGDTTGRGPGFALALLALYEPLVTLVGLWGIARLFYGGALATRGTQTARAMLAVWAIVGVLLLAIGGARQPELILLPVLPLALLAGATLGDLVESIEWRRGGWFWSGGGAILGLVAALALAAWGSAIGLVIRAFGRVTGQPNALNLVFSDRVFTIGLLLTVAVFALPLSAAVLWLAQRLGASAAWRALAVAGAVLLLAYGLRAAVGLSIYRADAASEPLVYGASTPQVWPLMDRLHRISRDVTGTQRVVTDPTGGHGLTVAVDPAVEWPVRWYLRDFPLLQIAGAEATRGALAPQVVFRPAEGTPLPAGVYYEQRYKLHWSYPAGEPLTGGDNGLLRFLDFLLFRKHAPPAPSSDVVVGWSADLAARLFPQPPVQGPFGLWERAGLGKAPGQFDSPRGIAIGRDGAIYVVDGRNARVQQFARDGAFVREFGGLGRGDGQLLREGNRGPTGIAIDGEGFVYVADTWNHRLLKFTADGAYVAKWGGFSNLVAPAAGGPQGGDRTGFYGPRGITIGPGNEVYVTDTGNGRVLVFNREGAFLREFGSKGAGPNQLNEPVGIAVSADGSHVFVADSNNARIAVFDAQGQPIAQWPVEAWRGKGYFEPYLALDADGALYATSSSTRQVLKLGRDGQIVATSSGTSPDDNLAMPIGVAVAPDRSLYLTDTNRHVVVRLAPLPDR